MLLGHVAFLGLSELRIFSISDWSHSETTNVFCNLFVK